MPSAYELAINLNAKDNASSIIDGLTSKLGGFSSFAGGVTTAAGGVLAVAGGAIASLGAVAFSTAADIESSGTLIQRSLGDNADAALDYEAALKSVFAANAGDSFSDIAQTIIEVEQATTRLGDVSQSALTAMAEDALRFRETFGTGTGESIGAATTLMEEFGLTSEKAFDFIVTGQQRGLDSSNDFLDTIREYSNVLDDGGFSAEQFFSIMETGLAGGVLGTDKIADALKEYTVNLNEGGEKVQDAFGDLGLNFDDIRESVARGDSNWGDYFDTIVSGINDIEDTARRAELQKAIFGTLAEDLGVEFTQGLSSATTGLEDMVGATDDLSKGWSGLQKEFQGFGRQFALELAPAGDAILEIVQDNLPALQQAVTTVAGVVGDLAVGFANAAAAAATGFNQAGILGGIGAALAEVSSATFSYDVDAQVSEVEWGEFSFTYDSLAGVTGVEWGEFSFTYDSLAGVTGVEWGEWSYTYDVLAGVTDVDFGEWNYTYDALASILDVTWGPFENIYSASAGIDDVDWGIHTNTYDADAAIGASDVAWGSWTNTYTASAHVPASNISWSVPNIVLQGTLNLVPRVLSSLLPSALSIPGRASGTAFDSGGLRVLGETGPELAMIPAGTRIFNADQTREMRQNIAANSGDVTVNIRTINGNVSRDEARRIGNDIGRGVLDRARAKGIR